MAEKFLDMTGKTEDEALSAALQQLGLDRDEVSVEVLERAKSGFLGFGASPAKIRVTYDLAEETPAPQPKPERKDPKPAEAKPAQSAAPAQETAKDQAPRHHQNKPERRETPEKPEHHEPHAAPAEDLGEICDDEKAQQIKTFLDGLLRHMESSAQVKVYQPDKGHYKVILEGEKLGSLIGRRGETLDAIQQLTNYSVNRGAEKRVRIHVDAENYRLKREQSLQHLAQKVAGKVIRYKRNVTLEPMNAYERHVIHTALQDVDGVTTYSMGTEPNRRVIVAYDRDKKQ
jgi:spoIIIJ-associated protein